ARRGPAGVGSVTPAIPPHTADRTSGYRHTGEPGAAPRSGAARLTWRSASSTPSGQGSQPGRPARVRVVGPSRHHGPRPRVTRSARVRVGPAVRDAGRRAVALLLHEGGQRAGSAAGAVPVPEQVPDLVVDQVLPVRAAVGELVLALALDPAQHVEHRPAVP